MSRRPHSSTPEPRPVKRQRLEHPPLTPDDYKGGVVLAPMVRSGALPTRLFALKHGAKLVWGPEIIDKAILHAERVVDPVSGVIQYHGKSKAMFTTHPIEKPYYIFQIGSASPELAVQAAKVIMDDVAGVDLNCGCPKPFSTSGGMGAALLSTPDLLCDILRALRAELPARVSVSAKIRLLPNQEDTLKLVEQICNTGINALTVHCRTRNQRMKEKATIERLREIVAFVEGLGKNIAVIANGDCQSFEDAKRVKEVTNAHSVMIATAAESNPTVFSPTPLVDVERTLVPQYIRLCKYLDNHWSSTKWCIAQFKAPHPGMTKAEHKADRDIITHAKSYADVLPIVGGEEGLAQGKAELDAIKDILEQREVLRRAEQPETAFTAAVQESADASAMTTSPSENVEIDSKTRSQVEASLEAPPDAHGDIAEPEPVTPPEQRTNPEPPSSRVLLIPSNLSKQVMPASVFNQDTPIPGGGVELPATS